MGDVEFVVVDVVQEHVDAANQVFQRANLSDIRGIGNLRYN